jgi:hypothetical protein
MRDVQWMIRDMRKRSSRELEGFQQLSVDELIALNELTRGKDGERLYYLINNAFLFGAACALETTQKKVDLGNLGGVTR